MSKVEDRTRQIYEHLQDPKSEMSTLATGACSEDSIDLLDQTMLLVSEESKVEQLRRHMLKLSIRRNATSVLARVIEKYGEDIHRFVPYRQSNGRKISTETLSVLLAHGWNINCHGRSSDDNRHPFLWQVTDDIRMIAWCLEHGAHVHPEDLEPVRMDNIHYTNTRFKVLLEICTEHGSVESWELLRSKGAPLGWRPLHLAVQAATFAAPDFDFEHPAIQMKVRPSYGSAQRESYERRMSMIRYLIDVVGCDVNAFDKPEGSPELPFRWGTPLCYVAGSHQLETDIREITWLLLDRGADPAPGLKEAQATSHPSFADAVAEWSEKQRAGSDPTPSLHKAHPLNICSRKRCLVQ